MTDKSHSLRFYKRCHFFSVTSLQVLCLTTGGCKGGYLPTVSASSFTVFSEADEGTVYFFDIEQPVNNIATTPAAVKAKILLFAFNHIFPGFVYYYRSVKLRHFIKASRPCTCRTVPLKILFHKFLIVILP